MEDEHRLARVLDELESLSRCMADSSSLIYLQKAGLLGRVAAALSLSTIPEVLTETGMTDPDTVPLQVCDHGFRGMPTDEVLVAVCAQSVIPLLSEDRKLLLRAERLGVTYYNSLMIVACLEYRGLIGEQEADDAVVALTEVARYGPRVLAYVRDLRSFIRKNL